MHLSWYGENCFKIQTKSKRGESETTIITDPFNRKIGLRPPQGQTNIITLSNLNYLENTHKFKGDPFAIDSPGEYSIKSVNIEGIESFQDSENGNLRRRNTIFTIESEGIRVCHLGNIGQILNENQVDVIGEVDILLIPIGKEDSLSLKQIKEIIGQLEPGIIIPMNYKVKGLKEKLSSCQDFCKEFGSGKEKGESRLTIKEKDVKNMENNLIVLNVS
jgi:L-ascorbate metabolism protein UlaG (beta-lactamase superfamily)